MPIFGRDDIFYDLLERQAKYVLDGAREFCVMVANMDDAAVHAESPLPDGSGTRMVVEFRPPAATDHGP